MISHQLFTMLKMSHFGGRYCAPSIRRVMKQTLVVYTYAACLASVCTWNVWGIPFKGGLYQGYACVAKVYDDPSTIFFWLGFWPLCVVIPMVYVISCIVRIYRGGMLPPEGQRSTLYMYFSLIFVFVFMWLPFIVITFVWGPAYQGVDSTWVVWFGAQFAHLQGLATVWTILFKKDVRSSFLGTISCGKITRSRSGGTSNTGRSTDRTGNVSGSIQLHSTASQQSRTVSAGYTRTLGLESINEIFGSASHVEPRRPGRDDKANIIADKDRAFNVCEKMMLSSFEDDVDPELRGFQDLLAEDNEVNDPDAGDDEDTFSDNVVTPLQVERDEAASSCSGDGGASVSSSVDAFVVNELSMIADCLSTEMQLTYEYAVIGVEGDDIIQIHVDEKERESIPVSSGHPDSSADTLAENDIDMNVECLPSDIQRIVYEEAASLGIGGEYIAQLLASINDDESRVAGTHSSDLFTGNGPKVVADCPSSGLQLKAQEDASALQVGKEILKNDDEKHCSVSVSSDETFLNMIANITNVPTAFQQMMFEDAIASNATDRSELINEEEMGISRV